MSNNPLPSSGPLSFSNINVELGRGSTATISIRTAEQGGYGTIRECKTPLPSGAPPASVSEWRGYNHNATASLAIDETVDGGTSCEDVCNQPVAGTGSLVAYAYTLGGSTNYYANFTCTQGLALGYYADMTRTNCYAVTAASPPLLTITACNVSTTSTTSTTTTECLSFSYAVVGSLTACSVGSYPETGYQNTGFGVGSRLYVFGNCRTGISDTYIQTPDGTNYELSSGIIQASNNQFC
jgi:hypothetical protein